MGKFKDKSKNIPQYLGSVFTAASSDAIKPPTGCVFVAITACSATTFDSTTGLIAEDATQWANTADAAGDLAAGSESVNEGSGGLVVASGTLSIPAGTTIYGRYTEIDLAGGTVIAYYTGGTQNTTLGSAETTTHANKAAAPGGPAV